MVDQVKKDNRGYLYPNKNKNKPTQPDYTGKCLVEGKEWRIGAWENKTPEGNTYLSLSFTVPLPPNSQSPIGENNTESKQVQSSPALETSQDLDIDSILGMTDDEDPFN